MKQKLGNYMTVVGIIGMLDTMMFIFAGMSNMPLPYFISFFAFSNMCLIGCFLKVEL